MYLIENGKVKLGYYTEEGEEIVNAILTKGELFGEKAILGEEKRNEFAQSVDSITSICPVSVNTLLDLMQNDKTFSLSIYKFLGFRFKKLERRLQLVLFKDIRTRFLEFVKELCDDYGHDCLKSGHKIITHPYTQKDIASLIGTSRSNLNVLMNELKNENIDVINYTSNIQLYITRALSPAKVSSIKINEETKRADVFLKLEEVSKAIGRGGHNIKLAGLLTGYELDVIREGDVAGTVADEDDVELTEFSDEIEGWVIEEFAKIGLDTAKSILKQEVDDLVRRTDLEEETILDVMRILKEEFDS